jgi:hypothetical protein
MPLPKARCFQSRDDIFICCRGGSSPRKDHAVVMVRFASDCRDAMMIVTRKLEVTLGPGHR